MSDEHSPEQAAAPAEAAVEEPLAPSGEEQPTLVEPAADVTAVAAPVLEPAALAVPAGPSAPLAPPAAWTDPGATPPLSDAGSASEATALGADPGADADADVDAGVFGGHPEVLAGAGFVVGFLLATALRRLARD